jgi:hypothetical protein
LLIYTYFGGQAAGSLTLTDTLIPTQPGEYFIVMFTNDSYTEVSNRELFTVVDPNLGITELAHGMKVYPNPVSGNDQMTVLSSEYPIDWIQIRDMNGKVVYRTENVNGQQFSLLTHQLSKGTYMLEIQSRKLFNYKIVVQ